jgi:hypothetical protein
VFFRARMLSGEFGAGPESLEVALVTPAEIPWGDIAFRSTDFTLRRYLEDKAAGQERHYFETLDRHAPPPKDG